MATESIVTFLLAKLDTSINNRRTLVKDVEKEVPKMKRGLERVKLYLRDADSRVEADDEAKNWVKRVREVAYDIEDVLDEYNLHLKKPLGDGVLRLYHKIERRTNHLKVCGEVKPQIEDIKERLDDILREADKYKFSKAGAGSSSSFTIASSHDPRDGSLYKKEDEIVGIGEPMIQLEGWLVAGNSALTTISVVGMAGLGKTTLVKQVCESQRVKKYFKFQAWMTVSRSLTSRELLMHMIKKISSMRRMRVPERVDSMRGNELKDAIGNILAKKRYVLVLDDIWHMEDWNDFRNALPCCNNGSRIVVTSRINLQTHGHVYKLKPLSHPHDWNLFCKVALQLNPGEQLPQEFRDLSREIVKRCEGLPLAIVAVGSLLSKKGMDLSECRSVCCKLGAVIPSSSDLKAAIKILAFSYTGLPYYLKSCFLYFGVFPVGQPIKRMRLIRLWIAEGLIQEHGPKTMEEVAEDYLDQLLNNNVIQVAEQSDDGRVRSYKVHGLMREIILMKYKEQKFCAFSAETNEENGGAREIRRLSIHSITDNGSLDQRFSYVRSFFAFGIDKLFDSSTREFFSHFLLLKVLDLENVPLEDIPESLTDLYHLRYLSLENTRIRDLPKSIGDLVNLETLNLKGTIISELPVQVLKLKKMRHLLVYKYAATPSFDSTQAMKLQAGIGVLTALQKLSMIEINRKSSSIAYELGKLTQLRRLGVTKLRSEYGRVMCSSITKMADLRSLSLQSTSADELLDLKDLSPPQSLNRLHLRGNLGAFPDWIRSLRHLIRLTLGWSRLKDDPFEVLQDLPALVELTLLEAYSGEVLYCEQRTGFPNLKSLRLDGLHRLHTIKVTKGAMPALRKMSICHCEALLMLPLGIEHLTMLKELNLYDMTEDFVAQMREDGHDYGRIKHLQKDSVSVSR